mgnify:CR=1 FL=1
MFEMEKQQIEKYKKTKNFSIFLFTIIKLVSTYFLITYLEFGIFIVLAYIFYSLEHITSYQFINSQESNLQINILYQNIEELKRSINYE